MTALQAVLLLAIAALSIIYFMIIRRLEKKKNKSNSASHDVDGDSPKNELCEFLSRATVFIALEDEYDGGVISRELANSGRYNTRVKFDGIELVFSPNNALILPDGTHCWIGSEGEDYLTELKEQHVAAKERLRVKRKQEKLKEHLKDVGVIK